MVISDKNRKLFEGVGLDEIRREIAVGYSRYLPIDPESQREAREWVAEKLEGARRERSFSRCWLIIGGLTGIIAAVAAAIAAWPVIKGWFR